MKKIGCFALSFAMAFSTFTAMPASAAQTDSAMNTYPSVSEYKTSGGEFTLTETSRLVIVSNNYSLQNEVLENDLKLLSSEFNEVGLTTGSMNIVYGSESTPKAGDIVIRMTTPSDDVSPEAYEIKIGDFAEVSATGEAGIFYGIRTIQKTMLLNGSKMDKGTITDAPSVEVRSLHLDAARKYFTMDWIMALIKDLSYQNINTIQFHFSENEGYRLESSTLEEKISGWHYPSDGYYTKEDMLDIIEECDKYHIELVPSLDSPGHLQYVLNQFPNPAEWNCTSLWSASSDFRSPQAFNIYEKEECRQFLKDLFTEYADFFSKAGCKHFNIGGDEFLNNFGSMTNEQYVTVMNYFNEISTLVKSYGMTPRAWNDGLMYQGYTGYKLDPDIEICYWSGPAAVATIEEFVENGNKVINMADVYMYYVLAQWWDQNANPLGSKIFNEWTPGKLANSTRVGDQSVSQPYPDWLAGASFAIWCDVPSYRTQDQISTNIFMRTRAMAERSWNPASAYTYNALETVCNNLGHAPGYDGEALPAPGNVLYEGEFGTLILKFVDTGGNELQEDRTVYGVLDETYTVTPDDIYNYRFVSMDKDAEGTFTDAEVIITLTYEFYTDKAALQAAADDTKSAADYIPATYTAYKEALAQANIVLADEAADQPAVDAALEALTNAKGGLVSLENVDLYLEVTYPVASAGYTASSYAEYDAAVTAAESVLYNAEATAEELETALANVRAKKDALIVPADGISVSGNKEGYYGWVDGSYQNFPLSNMIDGDTSTKAWINGSQAVGDYHLFTFSTPVTLNSVRIQMPENDDYIRQADIEISTDNSTWKTIGTLDNTSTVSYDASFEADGETVQYVRIRITKEDTRYWSQISEVSFDYEVSGVDTSSLETAIADADKLNADDYSSASWAVLTAALTNARTVLAAEGITIGEINAAVAALNGSVAALEKVSEETPTPVPTGTPEVKDDVTTIFDDVYTDWYTNYVQYVYDNNLMTGIKGTRHFAPNDNITKAQVAQVLYNMEEQPAVDDPKVFTELTDVYEVEWYANAVAWAYNNNVVTGDLNTKQFNPNADVTREQLALMMYRYAKFKGYDTSATSDFAGLENADKVANWSMDGVKWAVGAGLISGVETNGVKDLAPQGNATRAQVAAILQRFCENVK